MESLWQSHTQLPRFPALEGDLKTDVLVIGGGLAGLLCLYSLHQAGVDCALVEADRLCSGVTARTTAKVTAQHGLCYAGLLKRLGRERAAMYLHANLEALEAYQTLCRDLNCDFQERPSLVYTRSDRRALEEELAALEQLHYPAKLEEHLDLPFPTAGAVVFPRQAQFHPLKFAAALAPCLPIYEHTKVTELRGYEAVTDKGVITADRIVVTTHFPFLNKHGLYPLKLYQDRSYVLALEGVADLGGMYLDGSGQGLSLRWADGLLLLGGGAHRTGKPGGGWAALESAARRYWPKAKRRYQWATQDCMTLDASPYIGLYAKSTPRLFVATGFNKWGMTSSMVASKVLTQQILGKPSPYAPAFTPSRSLLHPQLAVNGAESALNLLTPTAPRCPHLGCALKWNRQEHSWDCPCHGSRFDAEGRRLNGPATGDLPRRPAKK